MKKTIMIVLIFMALILISTACEFNVNETTATGEQHADINDEIGVNNMEVEEVKWIEEHLAPIDECGIRTVGIRYREVDLSEPYWFDEYWQDVGFDATSTSGRSQFVRQSISTREEAADIANKLLESKTYPGMDVGQGIIGGLTLELMQIEHDPNQNIWIFSYWENNINMVGSSFHVAVNGNTSEILRTWAM